MLILGISAFYHDSAVCLVRDGEIIAAAQEERFTRKKHDSAFPTNAIAYCLKEGCCSVADLDYMAYYEKTSLKFDRLLKTYLMYAPRGLDTFIKALPVWIEERIWFRKILKEKLGYQGPVVCPTHHESHAAAAFYPSPFNNAAYITLDGVGEWTTLSCGIGAGNKLHQLSELRFPHSLGLLYSAFTYFCGFKVNSGEYKLMGLAPYGQPRYVGTIIDNLVDLKADGSFRLDMSYFDFAVGRKMTSEKFHTLFGRQPRKPESKIAELDMDLAASIQKVTEEIIMRIAACLHQKTNSENLCLSGGVALNCVANGRLYREGPFKRIWVQPAAGDAGSALGAALWVWHSHLGRQRSADEMQDRQSGSYLGPAYGSREIEEFLQNGNLPFEVLGERDGLEKVASLIDAGNVVGWFDGRMEFGPRALGARSIIGDARSPKMQSIMNLKIKYRESFRPFAPIVLAEDLRDWFDVDGGREPDPHFSSPYMLMVGHVRDDLRTSGADPQASAELRRINQVRSKIPAVTHVDYSARIQTVHKETNSRLHALLAAFKQLTGCPVLVNTSFNVRGEPIVESPSDAYRCFMRTEIDYLVMGNYLLSKRQQPAFAEEKDWQTEFELD